MNDLMDDLVKKFPMQSEVRVNGHGGIGIVIGYLRAYNATALIVEVSGEKETLYPDQVIPIDEDSDITTVFKYLLEREFIFQIETPVLFKPLETGVKGEDFYLWAEVQPKSGYTQQTFHAVLTGGIVPENTKYIGSLVDEKMRVWHYYWAFNKETKC